jgi:hypothetical protein
MMHRRSRVQPLFQHARLMTCFVGGAFAVAVMLLISSSLPGGATAADRSQVVFRSPTVEISGRVVAVGAGVVGIRETGSRDPVAFMVDSGTRVVRDGDAVTVSDLRSGDAVRMTVDGRTGYVDALRAAPRATGPLPSRHDVAWIAALTIVTAASVLFARARRGAWLTISQIEAMRPVRRFRWSGESSMPVGHS